MLAWFPSSMSVSSEQCIYVVYVSVPFVLAFCSQCNHCFPAHFSHFVLCHLFLFGSSSSSLCHRCHLRRRHRFILYYYCICVHAASFVLHTLFPPFLRALCTFCHLIVFLFIFIFIWRSYFIIHFFTAFVLCIV